MERLLPPVLPFLHPEDAQVAKEVRKIVKEKAREIKGGVTVQGSNKLRLEFEKGKRENSLVGLRYSDEESVRLILRKPGERDNDTVLSDAYWLLYYPPKIEKAEGKVSSFSVTFYPECTEKGAEYLEVSTSIPSSKKEYLQRNYRFRHG